MSEPTAEDIALARQLVKTSSQFPVKARKEMIQRIAQALTDRAGIKALAASIADEHTGICTHDKHLCPQEIAFSIRKLEQTHVNGEH